MAKSDFCYTYYCGDAAADKSHMNRLERGAYHDLLDFQKKVGKFTMEQARKVLSKDFDETWGAIEIILTVEGNLFFIEWLENSIERDKKFSKSQSDRGKKSAEKRNQNATGFQPTVNQSSTKYQRDSNLKEDGDGDEGEDKGENEIEGGVVENHDEAEKYLPALMLEDWTVVFPAYPVDKLKDLPALFGVKEFIRLQLTRNKDDPHFGTISDDEIQGVWQQLITVIEQDNFWRDKTLESISKNIQQFWNKAANATTRKKQKGKWWGNGTQQHRQSAGAMEK